MKKKHIPELVEEGKGADKTLALDYNSLIPVLTRAIQEQQTITMELMEGRAKHSTALRIQSAELAEIRRIVDSVNKRDLIQVR